MDEINGHRQFSDMCAVLITQSWHDSCASHLEIFLFNLKTEISLSVKLVKTNLFSLPLHIQVCEGLPINEI